MFSSFRVGKLYLTVPSQQISCCNNSQMEKFTNASTELSVTSENPSLWSVVIVCDGDSQCCKPQRWSQEWNYEIIHRSKHNSWPQKPRWAGKSDNSLPSVNLLYFLDAKSLVGWRLDAGELAAYGQMQDAALDESPAHCRALWAFGDLVLKGTSAVGWRCPLSLVPYRLSYYRQFQFLHIPKIIY